MLSYIYIRTCLWVMIGFFSLAGSVPWANPSQEILDELNDVEIYKAVVTSMNDWQRKQNQKKIHDRVKRQDTVACYPELGCFESSGPFGYLDMLPNKPEEIDTKFLLYPGHSKRRSGSPPAEVPFSSLNEAFEWAKQGFNNSLPTKVLIHGFGSDCSHIWVYEMRSALMAVEELNVICVDWENGAILPNYVKAAANTRLVGKQLAKLLKGLVDINGLSLRNTHLIGFSLGAHVAGFAGSEIGNLSRITGLDPAGPLFESQDPRARLDQSDASFVDVIHSNGENLILGGLGSYQPMGHVDFYPNGGRMQKGCSNLFVGAVSDIIWSSAVEGRSLCNHRRAYKFFTDSVSPRCHFPAFPCDSYEEFLAGKCFPCTDERVCGNMGYYADRSKGRGQMYLITRDEEPFCAHQYHVKIETSPSDTPIISYGKIQITLIGDSTLNETFMMTRKEDEEMKLGDSISRILVPHPILSEPNSIEILYTAYSGWLSSGLTQWRMEKVTLSDSFGKTLSVCKKNLILDSGVPITLPLYPGECNVPKHKSDKEAEDRNDLKLQSTTHGNFSKVKKSSFVPTPVVKLGPTDEEYQKEKASLSLRDAIDILNIPWKSDKETTNSLVDNEAESSRAFNTRVIKPPDKENGDEDGIIREIVEPVLKPHSKKHSRSHDPDKEKPEITEPILGPTTLRSLKPKPTTTNKNDFLSRLTNSENNKEITYNFYDVGDNAEWVPSVSHKKAKSERWNREDNDMKIVSHRDNISDNPFDMIATTVQFLPQRLARMFEQAEKYARETILPLVSTYTPKFISDIISPREKQKYLPLSYEEGTTEKFTTLASRLFSRAIGKRDDNKNNERETTTKRKTTTTTTSTTTPKLSTNNSVGNARAIDDNNIVKLSTTPYTHIQKIERRRKENIKLIFPTMEPIVEMTTLVGVTRKTREDGNTKTDLKLSASEKRFVTSDSGKEFQAIYIDLPVFETEKDVKYIPLRYQANSKISG